MTRGSSDEFYWRAAIVKKSTDVRDDVPNSRPARAAVAAARAERTSVERRRRAGARVLRAVSVWKCEGSLRPEDLLAAGTYRGRRVRPLINYDRTIVTAAAAVALLPLFRRHRRRRILLSGKMLRSIIVRAYYVPRGTHVCIPVQYYYRCVCV